MPYAGEPLKPITALVYLIFAPLLLSVSSYHSFPSFPHLSIKALLLPSRFLLAKSLLIIMRLLFDMGQPECMSAVFFPCLKRMIPSEPRKPTFLSKLKSPT